MGQLHESDETPRAKEPCCRPAPSSSQSDAYAAAYRHPGAIPKPPKRFSLGAFKHTELEHSLARQGEFLLSVIDSLDYPFYVIDAADYSVRLRNAAAERSALPGAVTCHAMLRKSYKPCNEEGNPCPLQAIKYSKQPIVIEHTYHDSRGRPVYSEVHASPVFDEQGNLMAIIECCIDITARKQAEQLQRDLEKRARQAERQQSLVLLAGSIAHEFNNLLTAILGSVDLASLKLGDGHGAFQEIDAIRKASLKAAKLTEEILACSGEVLFYPEPLTINTIAEDIGGILSEVVSDNISIKFEPTPDLPEVKADVLLLRQVLLNIVSNALEAIDSTNGSIIIKTGLIESLCGAETEHAAPLEMTPGRYVYLEIEDSGCGMADDVRQKAFEPFFTTKSFGRGLGLSAALGIVRRHAGTIQVRSVKDQGSAFRVLLPVPPA